MNPADVCFASIADIVRLVASGEVTAREITDAHLARIADLDGQLNCFTRVLADHARAAAQRIDADVKRGEPAGLLVGVPIAIKDLADVAGVPTTAGAHERFHTAPTADAPVVARLRAEGAIFIGKTNLHEFAYGVTNINPHFGPTRNPWNPGRIPGGSSGGSAAAVAAGLCAGALGTDTGGSVRIPASLCGVVGIKPTYGRVPRTGIVPLSWTLDHVGPLARTVRDAALLLRVMAGHDLRDPTSDPTHLVQPYDELMSGGIDDMRVGVPRGYFWERVDDEVREHCERAVSVLHDLGADVRDVEIPHAADAGAAVAMIISAEATAYHEARLRTSADLFGDDVRTRLERGLFVTGVDYVQAQRARAFLTRECLGTLADVDVLVMPATPTPASEIESELRAVELSLSMSLVLTRFTNPFNLTGLPALSVPCGFTSQGLPVGLQTVGGPWDEVTLLRVGHTYEQATEWHTRRPLLVTRD